jgi:hypothetical protein
VTGATGAVAGSGSDSAPAASVSITDQHVFDSSGTTATAIYTIGNNGTVRDQDDNVLEAWLLGTGGSVSNYEVRATQISGVSLTSGTLSTWLPCSTSRSWVVENSARDNSTDTATLSISIRLASSGVVQDTATVTLSAESFNFN